jgi:hypothetical protein
LHIKTRFLNTDFTHKNTVRVRVRVRVYLSSYLYKQHLLQHTHEVVEVSHYQFLEILVALRSGLGIGLVVG